MNHEFVLAGKVPDPKDFIRLELVQDGADFNIVATLPRGRKVKLVGLRTSTGRASAVRWAHFDNDDLWNYVEPDGCNRVKDLFT